MIELSPRVRERVEAFVEARLDGPLFSSDLADCFSDAVAEAWVDEQVSSTRAVYRIVDPHLTSGLGALIVAAHPPRPRTSWGEVLDKNSGASLYRVAQEWCDDPSRGFSLSTQLPE